MGSLKNKIVMRVSQADFQQTKEALGQVSTPLFRIFGLPQYFVACKLWLGKQKCSLEAGDSAMEECSIWFGAARILP